MKSVYSYPKSEKFYNFYIGLVLKTNPLLLFAHLVCGITEIFGTYALLQKYTQNLGFAGSFISVFIAIFTGIVIQGVLASFLPTVSKSILQKVWNVGKEHKIMFSFAIFAVVAVVLLSAMLSFEGSKELTNKVVTKDIKKVSADIDKQLAEIETIKAAFKADSVLIIAEKNALLSSYENKIKNTNAIFDEKIRQIKNKEVNTNQSFSTDISRTNEERENKLSVLNDSIFSINSRLSIAKINSKKDNKIVAILQEIKSIEKAADIKNENKQFEADEKTKRQGMNLGFVTIACLLIIIAGYFIKSNFLIGSKVEKTYQPLPIDFDQPAFIRYFSAINNKYTNQFIEYISKIEASTKPYIPTPKPQNIRQPKDGIFPVLEEYEFSSNGNGHNDNEQSSGRTCEYCGKQLLAGNRIDKRFCSEQCRGDAFFKKWNRYPKRWGGQKVKP